MDATDWFIGASILWSGIAIWIMWQHGKLTPNDVRGLIASYMVVMFLIVLVDRIIKFSN